MLDRVTSRVTSVTPLQCGRHNTVSQLLSAGARQPQACLGGKNGCPLTVAVYEGHEKVVEVLLDGGLEAIGGSSLALPPAIRMAVLETQARILHRLLSGEGEDRRAFWTNYVTDGLGPILLRAASLSSLPIVGVLMANGADENTRDSEGQDARDYVGFRDRYCNNADPVEANAAIRRMLERGPAFRARSWVYPPFLAAAAAAVDARRGGDGVSARGDPSAGGTREVPVRTRIYRPQGGNIFARLLDR